MSNPSDKPARESEFWRFSLNFYGLPDVAPACLVLQDEAGVDVNLLLYLLFLASMRREAGAEHVAKLDATVALWRDETVKPLRVLRRALKAGIGDIPPATSDNFRNMVKRVELEAERLEQLKLEETGAALELTMAGTREGAARANLAAYGHFLKRTFPAAALATVQSAFEASAR